MSTPSELKHTFHSEPQTEWVSHMSPTDQYVKVFFYHYKRFWVIVSLSLCETIYCCRPVNGKIVSFWLMLAHLQTAVLKRTTSCTTEQIVSQGLPLWNASLSASMSSWCLDPHCGRLADSPTNESEADLKAKPNLNLRQDEYHSEHRKWHTLNWSDACIIVSTKFLSMKENNKFHQAAFMTEAKLFLQCMHCNIIFFYATDLLTPVWWPLLFESS